MKFLILNTDYPEFLCWLYAQHPGLEEECYAQQLRIRNESLYGMADFYSRNLCKLGHEADDCHANNEYLQLAWAREHHLKVPCRRQWEFRLRRKIVPWVSRIGKPPWFYPILAERIRFSRPDVLLNQAMDSISSSFLKTMKPYVKFLVGQHAATRLPESDDLSCYDLAISSFPPTIDFFRENGLRAEFHRLGFESSVVSRLKTKEKKFDVTFIGSLLSVHRSRMAFLEALCLQLPELKIWGPGINQLSEASPIRKAHMGYAWGQDMYQVLLDSRITINHHGDIPPYANNCRLYEATGMGALLITDWKSNLHEMFDPGKEVLTYQSIPECVDRIRHCLVQRAERDSIARAGQMRTLKDHTYNIRMKELVDIIHQYI